MRMGVCGSLQEWLVAVVGAGIKGLTNLYFNKIQIKALDHFHMIHRADVI
jgi:hypothetical protein